MHRRSRLALTAAIVAIATTSAATAAEVRSSTSRATAAEPTSAAGTAAAWGLSPTEWDRYQSLMQGIRGSVSAAGISPVEVLGIHARNDAERDRYARLWARLRREDAERVLAFERAYQAAWREANPDLPMFDPVRLAPFKQPAAPTTTVQAGDELLFFALPACAACDAALPSAIQMVRDYGARLDLFVVGLKDDDALRRWAARHEVPPELVRAKRITLNHDRGQLAQLAGADAALPYVVRRRDGALAPFPALSAR